MTEGHGTEQRVIAEESAANQQRKRQHQSREEIREGLT
jgi:hypothetical protein